MIPISNDKLIKGFQEGHCLHAYVFFSKEIKEQNKCVVEKFKNQGKIGLEYLCKVLDNKDTVLREQSAHILGEIGCYSPKNEQERIINMLDERRHKEDERGVLERIDYAKDLIRGYSPQKIVEAYASLNQNGFVFNKNSVIF